MDWVNPYDSLWLESLPKSDFAKANDLLGHYCPKPSKRIKAFEDFMDAFTRALRISEYRRACQATVAHLVGESVEALANATISEDQFLALQQQVIEMAEPWLNRLSSIFCDENPLPSAFSRKLAEFSRSAKAIIPTSTVLQRELEEIAQLSQMSESYGLISVKSSLAGSRGGSVKRTKRLSSRTVNNPIGSE
ncbi:MAG: hypothetical protein KDD62_15070 [Bdellovibrionales bacterium]|nr:hypothetical protein [Bdellovibrionales bacterium]